MLEKDNTNQVQSTNEAVLRYFGICFVSSSPREGYVEHHTSTGKVIYIDRYKSISGYIDDITWYTRTYQSGKPDSGILITFNDYQTPPVTIRVSYTQRQFDSIVKAMFNVDFSKEVKLSTWVPKGKDAMAVALIQDNAPVKQKYTMNDLEDCPPAVKNPFTGTFDFTAQREWILSKFMNEVVPVAKAKAAERLKGNRPAMMEKPVAAAAAAPGTPAPATAPANDISGVGSWEDEEEFDW